MRRGQERYLSIPVIAVISAIVYIYLTTVLIYIERWFGLSSSQGIMNAAAFTAVAAMCVYTYSIAVLREPGWVPPNYIPDIEDTNNAVHEIKRKSGDLRYCQKCSHYKPPRAHHCRSCKRCVLRMDHHCIWIDNCVGHANYKIFLIFVMYAAVACFYSLVMLMGSLTVDWPKEQNSSKTTIYVISGVVVIPVSVSLLILLFWHICLIAQNKTTIEHHAGVRSMWLAEKEGDVYKHPYDVGFYDNITMVLGPNIFCWIFPSSGHIGSGLRFRTAYDYVS